MAAVSRNHLPLFRRGPPPGFSPIPHRPKTPPSANKKHTFILSNGVPFELDTKYAPVRVLGKGSYGLVCSCLNRDTSEFVAVKKIGDALSHPITALRTLREMQILCQIHHDNVISIKDVMVSSSPAGKADFEHVYLVHDLMDTDLRRVINSSPKLPADHCKYFLFQILTGLHHLHSAGVIYRDLKPENVLVKLNLDVKICDFGLAWTKHDDSQYMTEYMTTRCYRAPEILLDSDRYGDKVDMWSVGCIFAELLSGQVFFEGSTTMSQIEMIHQVSGTQSISELEFIHCERAKSYFASLPFSPGVTLSRLFEDEDPLAVDLLGKMHVLNPEKRISAIDALRHPYFLDIYVESSTKNVESVRLEVDEDPNAVDEKLVRELIWDEMLIYHPDQRDIF